jgi:hypothetical protein
MKQASGREAWSQGDERGVQATDWEGANERRLHLEDCMVDSDSGWTAYKRVWRWQQQCLWT